jgi:hypothetical protein
VEGLRVCVSAALSRETYGPISGCAATSHATMFWEREDKGGQARGTAEYNKRPHRAL